MTDVLPVREFDTDIGFLPVGELSVKRISMSIEERERLYHTELVKAGVDFWQAAKAAKVLALNVSDEQLTEEESKLVQAVCAQWLAQRKRTTFISQVLNQSHSNPPQSRMVNRFHSSFKR